MRAPDYRGVALAVIGLFHVLATSQQCTAADVSDAVTTQPDKRISAPRPLVAADVYLRTEAGREIGRANAITPSTPVYSQWYQHYGPGGPFALHARWAGYEFYRVGTARQCLLSLLWWFDALRSGGALPPLG